MLYSRLLGLMRCTFAKYYTQLLSLQSSKMKPWKQLSDWLTDGKETLVREPHGDYLQIISLRKLAVSTVTRYILPYLHLSSNRFLLQRSMFQDPSSASVLSPDLKVIDRCFHRNPQTSLKYKINNICRLESWFYFNNLLERPLVFHPQIKSNLQKLLNKKDI